MDEGDFVDAEYPDGVLSDNEFHPGFAVWFADELEAIANAMDEEPEDMVADLVGHGKTVLDRAWVYINLIGYYGVHEFDGDPLRLTRIEARARYKGIEGRRRDR